MNSYAQRSETDWMDKEFLKEINAAYCRPERKQAENVRAPTNM